MGRRVLRGRTLEKEVVVATKDILSQEVVFN